MGPLISILTVWVSIGLVMVIFYMIQLKTRNAASTERIFLEKMYVPPDSGNADDISAKVVAVANAISPFNVKARIADGPVTLKATPDNARIPPPTMAPTPTAVAPQNPSVRVCSSAFTVTFHVVCLRTARERTYTDPPAHRAALVDAALTRRRVEARPVP